MVNSTWKGELKMNEQFFQLSQEKQMHIINAALEVFSQNEYKRAVTADIAAKAGISKGLLFYYFHNKKALYMYLLEYSVNLVKSQLINENYNSITDFFELIEYISNQKILILIKNPFITDFVVRSFYSQSESVSKDSSASLQDKMSGVFSDYLANVDFSKFRDDLNPLDIFNMLFWLTDGYLHDKRSKGLLIIPEEIVDEYKKWSNLIRRSAYKEEYL